MWWEVWIENRLEVWPPIDPHTFAHLPLRPQSRIGRREIIRQFSFQATDLCESKGTWRWSIGIDVSTIFAWAQSAAGQLEKCIADLQKQDMRMAMLLYKQDTFCRETRPFFVISVHTDGCVLAAIAPDALSTGALVLHTVETFLDRRVFLNFGRFGAERVVANGVEGIGGLPIRLTSLKVRVCHDRRRQSCHIITALVYVRMYVRASQPFHRLNTK